jgi:hypothetical protein
VVKEEISKVMREHASYMSKKRTGAVADCPSLIIRHCLNRRVAIAWRCLFVHVTGDVGIKLAQVDKVGATGRVARFPCGVSASK